MINYILWETCPNAGEEATGLEPHPCIVSLVRIAVFCAHWTEPPRRGAEFSIGLRAGYLWWNKPPVLPWEVGGKRCTPGDGSTTRALLRFMRPVHLPPGCVEEEVVFTRENRGGSAQTLACVRVRVGSPVCHASHASHASISFQREQHVSTSASRHQVDLASGMRMGKSGS